ncbi:MAG TPA: SprT family zinc-dependent metalloprotease [Candidatus Kapabacteria bacterium]|nr:SprT family zinc-dependent metalloprotease [Candidatus Kapabacteria bacterium]
MDDLKQIIDKIIKSNRKTCSLEINKQGRLVIRVPNYYSEADINHILHQKQDWIIKHHKIKQDKIASSQELKEGRTLYLGEFIDIEYIPLNNLLLKYENKKIYININNKSEYKEILYNWYRINAKKYLINQVNYYANKYDFTINNIRIKDQKRRWGSCSNKKNINLNWRLIMANNKIIEYIIIHELAHTVELNHSVRFWNIVKKILPDYKETENQIKSLEYLLDL